MSSRASKGCLRCRTRRVKCDEGRPSCRRCIQRSELCTGYPDESSLVFRNENEKAARTSVRRRASTQSLSSSGTLGQASNVSRFFRGASCANDPSDLSTADISSLNLSDSYPWAKAVPKASAPSVEDQAVSQFFEKYVMYPCNQNSTPGFFEHLPNLFSDIEPERRLALRWAVRAAAYGNLSNEQSSAALGNKALQCYGLALSALADTLADPRRAPDDYTLMTVVVLDLFEAVYLPDSVSPGSHAEGMAQILRLRGPNQIYGARGWSLFRLSHHRLQRQQLAFKQGPLPESDAWLESLNDELPYVRIEKDNLQVNKVCERARNLRKSIDDATSSVEETLDMIKEMHDIDRVSNTWRDGPGWAYKTIPRPEKLQDGDLASEGPDFVQLHRDVWIAYEWNYARTGRVILHEHLLQCLDRLESLYSGGHENFETGLCLFRQASIKMIQGLVDHVLSTVPQSLGYVDHEGNLLESSSGIPKCRGVGAYFLLWPIRVIKSTRSATPQQRVAAQGVFERIRELTGMKTTLGEASNV